MFIRDKYCDYNGVCECVCRRMCGCDYKDVFENVSLCEIMKVDGEIPHPLNPHFPINLLKRLP